LISDYTTLAYSGTDQTENSSDYRNCENFESIQYKKKMYKNKEKKIKQRKMLQQIEDKIHSIDWQDMFIFKKTNGDGCEDEKELVIELIDTIKEIYDMIIEYMENVEDKKEVDAEKRVKTIYREIQLFFYIPMKN
jgi:hypothetical protein